MTCVVVDGCGRTPSGGAWFDLVDVDLDLPPEPDRHLLSPDVESIAPGVLLAAVVAANDRARLNGHDAVRLMKVENRLVSHFEAGRLATMIEVANPV